MREISENTVQLAMKRVQNLSGMPVKIKVNRGRNKIELFRGKVESTYPQIFTVRKEDGELNSFSYSDVVSKTVCFYKP